MSVEEYVAELIEEVTEVGKANITAQSVSRVVIEYLERVQEFAQREGK